MQIVFFKSPKPRQFDYKPRYYDEEKERKEEMRRAMADAEKGIAPESNIKRDIDLRWRRIDSRNRHKSKSINLLVYLVVVALLIYFMFFV